MSESGPQSNADALRKQIEERAYALWESDGRPHGRNLDHWLQAEAEIMAARDIGPAVNPPPPASPTSRRKTDPEG
jgi:hypothetical protein